MCDEHRLTELRMQYRWESLQRSPQHVLEALSTEIKALEAKLDKERYGKPCTED
jgi:hypothetical protein